MTLSGMGQAAPWARGYQLGPGSRSKALDPSTADGSLVLGPPRGVESAPFPALGVRGKMVDVDSVTRRRSFSVVAWSTCALSVSLVLGAFAFAWSVRASWRGRG